MTQRHLASAPGRRLDAVLQPHTLEGGGLGALIERLTAGSREPVWIGWSVEGLEDGGPICSYRDSRGCRCAVDGKHGWTMNGDDLEGRRPDASGDVAILVRAGARGIERIRMFDADCELDFGGATLHLVEGVDAEASLDWLERQVETVGRELREDAVAAIAQHRHARAERLLRGYLEGSRPLKLRKNAAFWLGTSRGAS